MWGLLLLLLLPTGTSRAQTAIVTRTREWSVLSQGNSIWIGSKHGLYRFRPQDRVWSAYGPGNGLLDRAVRHLELNDDILWIGQERGITAFDTKGNTIIRHDSTRALRVAPLRHVAFEGEYVWALGHGAARYDPLIEEWQDVTAVAGLHGDTIHAALPAGNAVFLADALGVTEYDARYERHRRYPLPDNQAAVDAFVSGTTLWLLREHDLLRFNNESRVFARYPLPGFTATDIRSIHLRGSTFWLLAGDDLWTYEATTDALKPFLETEQLPERAIKSISITEDGRYLWFATSSGLMRYEIEGKRWTPYTPASGLPSTDVDMLFAYGDGVIAFGASGIFYNVESEQRWYTQSLLHEEQKGSGALLSLDPAKGSFVDMGEGLRLDLSGSNAYWQWYRQDDETTGLEQFGERYDLKARLELGGERHISAMYNNQDYETVTYGAEYRGAREDVLQSLAWGDLRSDRGTRLLTHSGGVFGLSGRAVYGERSERYGRSLVEVAAISGHYTTAAQTDAFLGRSIRDERIIEDIAWTRRSYFSLHADRGERPLPVDRVELFRTHITAASPAPPTLRARIADREEEWARLEEGKDYVVDRERGVVQCATVPMQKLAARVYGDNGVTELLLADSSDAPMELRNRYSLGAEGILPATFRMRITDASGMSVPLQRYGLDADGDGAVDAAYVYYQFGTMRFPDAHPFAPEVYATPASGSVRMHIRFEALQAGYKLSRSRILRGSEQVTVDGVLFRPGDDYLLDYVSGFLLFTRDGAVHDDSRIEVTYEYVRNASDERYTQAGITVSPSDNVQLALSAGQFHSQEWNTEHRFAQASGEIRYVHEDIDIRVQPEYQSTWSDTSSGAAYGMSAALSSARLRLSMQSTVRDDGFAQPTTTGFALGRLRDEHRVQGEYDLGAALRGFASWSKRLGDEWLGGGEAEDEYGSVGMQWLPPGLPSLTLRAEHARDAAPALRRSRGIARLDVAWVPEQRTLDGLGITALRLTGQARVGEERIDIGERPGRYGMHSLYLRTVVAPTAPSTINVFYQGDARQRALSGGGVVHELMQDRATLDVVMDDIRGLSLGGRFTADAQQAAATRSAADDIRRSSALLNLRLSPGSWLNALMPFTVHISHAHDEYRYHSNASERGALFVGLVQATDGVQRAAARSDRFETRVEWRPSSGFLYSIAAVYNEREQQRLNSRSAGYTRELRQYVDWRPNEKTLMGLSLPLRSISEYSLMQRELVPSVWLERRLGQELLIHFSHTTEYRSIRHAALRDGTQWSHAPRIGVTVNLSSVPVLRRIDIRNESGLTFRRDEWEGEEVSSPRSFENSSYVDVYPHPVLTVRVKYNLRRYHSQRTGNGTVTSAQLTILMQL